MQKPREAIVEIVQFVRFLANDDSIFIGQGVAVSETAKGHRNAVLAQFMAGFAVLRHPVEPVPGIYFHQCALAKSCRQLAQAAIYLANALHRQCAAP